MDEQELFIKMLKDVNALTEEEKEYIYDECIEWADVLEDGEYTGESVQVFVPLEELEEAASELPTNERIKTILLNPVDYLSHTKAFASYFGCDTKC